MEDDERELFERSLRGAAAGGAELDAALEDLGWSEALASDPRAAVSLLFGILGEANASSSALGTLFAHALGLGALDGAGGGVLPRGVGAAVVLPAVGRADPPGSLRGGTVEVDGLSCVEPGPEGLVVVCAHGTGSAAVAVPAASLRRQPVRGVDPDLGLATVTGRAPAGDGLDLAPGAWDSAVALGRLALAHQLVGAASAMLDLARRHALDRVQFGQPVASYQAVRHRLADTLVAVELARALLDAAWLEGTPTAAAMAKATAGRQARTAGRHCQQVLAGIGFTTEHPLHRYVYRTLALDALLGATCSLTRQLGARVLETGTLPPLPPL